MQGTLVVSMVRIKTQQQPVGTICRIDVHARLRMQLRFPLISPGGPYNMQNGHPEPMQLINKNCSFQ
jgi:hypothetical protein